MDIRVLFLDTMHYRMAFGQLINYMKSLQTDRKNRWTITGMIIIKDACVTVSCGYSTCFHKGYNPGVPFRVRKERVEQKIGCEPYTQKLTRSTLALKLSVSPPYYPWVTATAYLKTQQKLPKGSSNNLYGFTNPNNVRISVGGWV